MTWTAKLSNEQIIKETKPIPGEKTPWQALLEQCREENVEIEELSLVVGNIKVFGMPNKMCDGYMQATRAFTRLLDGKTETKMFRGIGSVIGDKVYITWIDPHTQKNGIRNTFQEMCPLSEVLMHTTLS